MNTTTDYDPCSQAADMADRLSRGDVTSVEAEIRKMLRASPFDAAALLLTLAPLLSGNLRETLANRFL